MRTMKKAEVCPCGKPIAYEACCGRLHRGELAADAEGLMRSRYSAYVLGLETYLHDTWHPTTRPPQLDLDASPAMHWTGLEVMHFQQGEGKASVEFVARYKINGRAHRLHEISDFLFEQGRWFYLDGTIKETPK